MIKKLTGLGMLGAIVYLSHVVIGGLLWKGYNHLQQPISDLTSSGGPDKVFLTYITTLYGVLSIIFAFCAFLYVQKFKSKLLKVGFFLFLCMHIVSISYNIFPEDMITARLTFTGGMHMVVTGLIVPLTILSILFVGIGFRKVEQFKDYGLYSILTSIFIFIVGGLSVIIMANKIGYFGLVERLNIGSIQLWMFLVSYKLFKTPENKSVVQ